MIKALFFDNSGVLMQEGYRPGIEAYERDHGIEPGALYASAHDRPYWKEWTLGNITEEQYYQELKKDFPGELDVAGLKEIINQKSLPNSEALSYIRGLKDRFILGVIANNPKEWFDYYERKFGFADIFGVKAASGYLHIRKPDPKIFEWALQQAGVPAAESVYIDDRPERVNGAETLGMKVIIYRDVPQLRRGIAALVNN